MSARSLRSPSLLGPVAMALVVVLVACSGAQGSEILTEQNVTSLLAISDVEGVLTSDAPLTSSFFDYKSMAESVDPKRAAGVDSWYGLTFQAEDGAASITFVAMDFDSPALAGDHFEKVKSDSQLRVMEPSLGDASAQVEVNAGGFGSSVVFLMGDKEVQLHTTLPDGEAPLTTLEGLRRLARLVEKRLQ